jgi:hypothetical protein
MGIQTFCCGQKMEYKLISLGTDHKNGFHFWDFENDCKICGKRIVGVTYDYFAKNKKEEDIT